MATFTFTEVDTVDTLDNWVCGDSLWASGFGLWLLVGAPTVASTSGLQTSPDRTTWTMRTMPSTDVQRSLAYASTLGTIGRAVAVGSGVASWSDDGTTWAAATVLPEANNWTDVVWWAELEKFVACSSNGANRIMTSADGKTWASQAAASALVWSGLAVSATVAVCVAFDTSVGTQLVQTSADGVTWALQTHPSIKTNRGLGGGIGARVGVGYSADLDMFLMTGTDAGNITKAYRSTDDGVTWTASGVIPTIANSLARNYLWLASIEQWYMPTAGWNYGLSADGDTWTIGTIPVSINNALYVAMGWDDSALLLGGTTGSHDTALVVAVTDIGAISPARGTSAGGTVCTITGVGLGSVASVTFDGTAATDVVPAADGLSLTCLAPAHAVGSVDVVVTGVGTLTAAYTYVTVTKVTPDTGTTFGGVAVTITGYGFDLATGVTFDGVTATSIVFVSNTVITAVTPQHASGAVDVVVIGVGTRTAGYVYELPVNLLPPYPYYSPLEEGGTKLISGAWARWVQEVKQRVEGLPGQVAAESIIGVFGEAQIPDLPWSRILKTGSSLADLDTADAGDLTSGTLPDLRMPALTGAVTTTEGAVATTAAGLYIVQGTADANLTGAQFLGALATGLVKNTTATGVLSIGVAATDYVAPSAYASANGLTMATARLLGRTTAGTGAAEELSVAGDLTLAAGVLTGTAASTTAITDDTTTNATMYPLWVTAATGSLPLKVSSTKLTFNPSTGTLAGIGMTASSSMGVLGSAGSESLFAYNTVAGATTFSAKADGTVTINGTVLFPTSIGLSINAASGGAWTPFAVTSNGGSTADWFVISAAGRVGVNVIVPTALLHLQAGTTAASTAPLKFTSGSLLTAAEAGAVEFLTDAFYGTITTGAARKTFAFTDGTIAAATATTITDDTTTNATMYPTWVTAATGNLAQKVSSTKLSFNPSTGLFGLTAATIGPVSAALATASPIFAVSRAGAVVIAGENTSTSSNSAGAALALYSNDGAAMASTDRLGIFLFGGSSSASALRNTVLVGAFAENAWTDGSDYGSYLAFETTTPSGTTRTVKAAISGAGHVLIGTGGITLVPATGTAGLIFEDGTALASLAANTAGLYAEDVGGTVMMHVIDEAGNGGRIPALVTKSTTGDPTGHEGLFAINTFDNTFKVYADAAWRTLASGW